MVAVLNNLNNSSKIKVKCPNCGRSLRGATTEMIGDFGICQKCRTEFVIVDSADWKPQDIRKMRAIYLILFLFWVSTFILMFAVPSKPAVFVHLVTGLIFVSLFINVARRTLRYSVNHLLLLTTVILFMPFISVLVFMITDRKIYKAIKEKEALLQESLGRPNLGEPENITIDGPTPPTFTIRNIIIVLMVVLLTLLLGFLVLSISKPQ